MLIFGPLLDLLLPEHPSIVMSVSVAILTGMGLLLLDYLSEVKRLITPPEIHFHHDQQEADKHLRTFIESARPSKADLLECASATVHDNVIKPLVTGGCNIRLLILNPKVDDKVFKPCGDEKQRICGQIRRLNMEEEVAQYDNIRIRFYNEPPSLRGRKFGNRLVNVGWFTYELQQKEDLSADCLRIWGHNNPLVSIASSEKDFDVVEGMFSKVFKNLWGRADLPRKICNACPEKQNQRCPVSDAWLDRVSRDNEEKL